MLIVEDIRLNGERLGRIVARVSLDQLLGRLWRFASISLLVLTLSLAVTDQKAPLPGPSLVTKKLKGLAGSVDLAPGAAAAAAVCA